MSSQVLSIDFDSKASFMESSFDSSFNYMDSGLDYFQYPPSSPSLGVSVGLPQTGSPMDFSAMNTMNEYTYSSSTFGAASPPRSFSPPDVTTSPPTVPFSLSNGELSSDGMASGRISRGSGSHSPPAYSAIPRSHHRFNPMAVPTNRANAGARATHKRKSSRSNNEDSDDEDEDFQPGPTNAGGSDSAPRDSRRETVRKQRIESEQRRRDELREGYARLKDTLPPSNQKASKVSLLDRATGHIKYLDAIKEQLEVRLKTAEHEVHRLRQVNEALMLNRAGATAPLSSPPAYTN